MLSEEIFSIFAPKSANKANDCLTSSISGKFLMMIFSDDKIAAGIIFRAEFLAPLTSISPCNLDGPLMMYLDIKIN